MFDENLVLKIVSVLQKNFLEFTFFNEFFFKNLHFLGQKFRFLTKKKTAVFGHNFAV